MRGSPVGRAARLEVHPQALFVFAAAQGFEAFTGAGAGNALTVLDLEQGAVGGALDQAGTVIEELVGPPFERDAAMGAAVDIEVGNAVPAYGQQFATIDFKTEAAVWREGLGGAEKLHFNP